MRLRSKFWNNRHNANCFQAQGLVKLGTSNKKTFFFKKKSRFVFSGSVQIHALQCTVLCCPVIWDLQCLLTLNKTEH